MVKFLMVFLCLILLAAPTYAQDTAPDSCSALIEQALASVGDHCDDLDRNSACYGHYRVDAHFIETDVDLQFDSPADRVMLTDLHSIATAPYDPDEAQWGLAVLKVQANLPDTLPGQAVTFLLMGDAQITDDTAPAEAAPPITSVEATVTANVSLRGGPGTDYNIAGSATAGQTLTLTGTNTARDWYQISDDDGIGAWVWGNLIQADSEALSTLPVVTAYIGGTTAPAYGPMQAFTLSTGIGLGDCKEVPDGLLIDAPPGQHTTVMVNGVQLTFGSAAFLTAYPDDVVTVQGLTGSVDVTALGETVTITAGQQTTVPLEGLEANGPPSEPEIAPDLGVLPGLRRAVISNTPYDAVTATDLVAPIAVPSLYDGTVFNLASVLVDQSDCYYPTETGRQVGDVVESVRVITLSEDGLSLTYDTPSGLSDPPVFSTEDGITFVWSDRELAPGEMFLEIYYLATLTLTGADTFDLATEIVWRPGEGARAFFEEDELYNAFSFSGYDCVPFMRWSGSGIVAPEE